MWLFYPKDSGVFRIYNYNTVTEQFDLKETLPTTFSGHISSVSVTNDHIYLAFAIYTSFVFIYTFDGTNYTQLQQISVPVQRLHLTDDHEYLTVTTAFDSNCYIYKFDGSQFNLLPNNGTLTLANNTFFGSLSEDKEYLGVTVDGAVVVYENVTIDNAVSSASKPGSYINKFTKNSNYLISGGIGEAYLYKIVY